MNSDAMWLGLVALGGGLASALIGFAYLLLRLREAEQRVRAKPAAAGLLPASIAG